MATIQSFTIGQVLTAQQMSNLQGYVGVVQVKSVTKTDKFTTTSTTFVDITGLSVAITPTSASNKVLCFYTVSCQTAGGVNLGGINLLRDSTIVTQGDTAGSRLRATSIVNSVDVASGGVATGIFLDSPATTSATTYKLQTRTSGAGTVTVNSTITDTDIVDFVRAVSTLTIMEVTP